MKQCPTSVLAVAMEPKSEVAVMWLVRDTASMSPQDLSTLARHIARTRAALQAAGRRVHFVDDGARRPASADGAGPRIGPAL